MRRSGVCSVTASFLLKNLRSTLSTLLPVKLAFDFEGVDKVFGEQVVGFGAILFNATGIAEGGQIGIDGQLCQQRSAGHIDQFGAPYSPRRRR